MQVHSTTFTTTMNEHPIILFDGVCNLCNGSVKFVLKRDKTAQIRFAPLQSAAGNALCQIHHIDPTALDSFIFIENGSIFKQSTAALRICRHLSFPWPLIFVCIIIPRFIRDRVYNWIARNRYNWFGKKESCMIPTPEVRSRFLTD